MSDLILEASFEEMAHIRAALGVALSNFEIVATFGYEGYTEDIATLRNILDRVEVVLSNHSDENG